MDIPELISSIEVELEAAQKRAQKAKAEIKMILDMASQEGRASLSEDEEKRTQELFGAIDLSKAAEKGIRAKLENARKVAKEDEEMEQREKEVSATRAFHKTQARADTRSERVHVVSEPRTYAKENDPHGRTFLMDVCRQFMYADVQASSRLSRHMQEERVENAAYLERAAGDSTTVNWAGLTVPQYLTDMVAPAVANLRPFADVCNQHPLPPDGMSVNISRVTTPTSTSLQASELVESSATSIDDTLLTINVQTASGEQVVSRQAIDRGSGIEDVILQDLFARYATTLDNTLLNQATTGLTNVAQGTAYTDATPTAAELYPFIVGAASKVEGAMLAMGKPDKVVMHSRRWYWLASQLGSTWPLINTMGFQAQATGQADPTTQYGDPIRGILPMGLSVVVDNNVTTTAATNQDEVYVVPTRECHLWEDSGAPAFIRAEQPAAGRLGVLLVVYGYFAYTFGRYANAMQKITDTGLIAPAGF